MDPLEAFQIVSAQYSCPLTPQVDSHIYPEDSSDEKPISSTSSSSHEGEGADREVRSRPRFSHTEIVSTKYSLSVNSLFPAPGFSKACQIPKPFLSCSNAKKIFYTAFEALEEYKRHILDLRHYEEYYGLSQRTIHVFLDIDDTIIVRGSDASGVPDFLGGLEEWKSRVHELRLIQGVHVFGLTSFGYLRDKVKNYEYVLDFRANVFRALDFPFSRDTSNLKVNTSDLEVVDTRGKTTRIPIYKDGIFSTPLLVDRNMTIPLYYTPEEQPFVTSKGKLLFSHILQGSQEDNSALNVFIDDQARHCSSVELYALHNDQHVHVCNILHSN